MNGLALQGCQHERQEYREMSWGEELWVCLDCNEVSLVYRDTQGG